MGENLTLVSKIDLSSKFLNVVLERKNKSNSPLYLMPRWLFERDSVLLSPRRKVRKEVAGTALA